MYKLITSSKGCIDLSIGFHHDIYEITREFREFNNHGSKVKFCVRICSKDSFGFAEHQQNTAYGLGCKLRMKRKNDKNATVHSLVEAADVAHIN